MRRPAAVLGLCAAAWSGVAGAADVPAGDAPAPPPATPAPASPSSPGADQIQFAAREHDLGYRAYLDKQFDEAANHFENAFFAAPNTAELRSAIRARRDAGELARAATLAAIGERRFPNDALTSRVAADVIAQARPHVHEVQIASSAEYSVALDEKIVAAERVRETRIFVNPGAHEILVSWSDDRNTRIPIDAREGGTQSFQLEPPAPQPPAPIVPPTPPAPVPVVPPPVATAPPVATVAPPPPSSPKPFPPAVFIAGASLTAVGLGVSVWSGIDTLNNPGKDAVHRACAGQTPQCPLYATGRDSQLRTNILFAATGGMAALTAVVGIFLTQWPAPAATGGVNAVPVVGIDRLGVEGTF